MESVKMSRSRAAVTLAGLMLGVLMSSMDTTVIGTSMPAIVRDLAGMEHYSWPFTAYLLCCTLAVPIFGKLADTVGRQLVFLLGIAEFIVASGLCGLSSSMEQLILFRGMQGLGGGVIVSSAFAIVGEAFPGRERGKYMGLVAAMFGVSSIVGPSIGGFLTDSLGWRWAFYINLPLGVVSFAILAFGLSGVRERRSAFSLDVPGVILFIASLVPLMLALALGGRDYGWASAPIVVLLAVALVSGIAFVAVERRVRDPLLPPYLFREREFSVSAAATFFSSAVFYAGILFLPLYMQEVLHASTTGSALAITPMLVSYSLASVFGGQLCSRLGKYRSLSIVSALIAGAAMVALCLSRASWGATPVILAMVVLGVGLGLSVPVFNIAAQSAFEPREIGTVTSAIQFFRYVGSSVGSAIFGTLMISRLTASLGAMDWGKTPSAIRGALDNPKVLMNPAAIRNFGERVPAQYKQYMDTLILKVDGMLASAIHSVFLAAAVFSALLLLSVLAYSRRESR